MRRLFYLTIICAVSLFLIPIVAVASIKDIARNFIKTKFKKTDTFVNDNVNSNGVAENSENIKIPPAQPSGIPGGVDYKFENVLATLCESDSVYEYWIFEPLPKSNEYLPLIMFNHGWLFGKHPNSYRAWIDHLVKKGNIIIFPVYQENARTSPSLFTMHATGALKRAIVRLFNNDHTKPDLNRFATIGHSAGGIISVNVASMAEREHIPRPKAIMSVNPGVSRAIEFEDLSKIPMGTLLVAMAGDKDNLTINDAKKIFYETTNILPQDKNLIIVPTDRRGTPDLIADHFAPCGIKTDAGLTRGFDVNTLDYYAYWKIFDGLIDAAFYNINREYALGNTSRQKYMGEWSDGTPVKELVVITNPNPANFLKFYPINY